MWRFCPISVKSECSSLRMILSEYNTTLLQRGIMVQGTNWTYCSVWIISYYCQRYKCWHLLITSERLWEKKWHPEKKKKKKLAPTLLALSWCSFRAIHVGLSHRSEAVRGTESRTSCMAVENWDSFKVCIASSHMGRSSWRLWRVWSWWECFSAWIVLWIGQRWNKNDLWERKRPTQQ